MLLFIPSSSASVVTLQFELLTEITYNIEEKKSNSSTRKLLLPYEQNMTEVMIG